MLSELKEEIKDCTSLDEIVKYITDKGLFVTFDNTYLTIAEFLFEEDNSIDVSQYLEGDYSDFYEALTINDFDNIRKYATIYDLNSIRLQSPDRGYCHPLTLCDCKEALEILLDAGADINGCDMYGATALSLAVENFDLESVKFLLHLGADPGCKDVFGMSIKDILDRDLVQYSDNEELIEISKLFI